MGLSYQGITQQSMNSAIESDPLKRAYDVIDEAFLKYCLVKDESDCGRPIFDLSRVLVAFNGGKDCTLLLHLILSRAETLPAVTRSIRLMYIRDSPSETFPEVEDFVDATKKRFSLDSIEVANGDMRSALGKVVRDHPEVRAIFMGTRWTDPNAKWMDYFCSTSAGWPKMDLVAPILRMSYADLWRIMAEFAIPYCDLYRRGYTSIGTVSDTIPNPALKLPDGTYLHANQLTDPSLERHGRTK